MDGTILCIAVLALMFVLFVATIGHYRKKIWQDGRSDREASKNSLMIIIALSTVTFMAVYGLCVIHQDWMMSHSRPILILAFIFALYEMKTMKKGIK